MDGSWWAYEKKKNKRHGNDDDEIMSQKKKYIIKKKICNTWWRCPDYMTWWWQDGRHTRFHNRIKKKNFVSDDRLDTRTQQQQPTWKVLTQCDPDHTRHVQRNYITSHYITSRHSNMCNNNTTTTQHSLVLSVSHDKYLYIESITTPQQSVIKTLWQS
jgi:hypothetical protein